jgi:hypothetical protein
MNGTTHSSDLTNTNVPTVDNTWTLIGAQDFNNDFQPDLVWAKKNSNSMVVWFMTGTTPGFSIAYTLPSGYSAVMVADSTSTSPNILMRDASGHTAVAVPDAAGNIIGWSNIASPTADVFTGPGASGHYHNLPSTGGIERFDIAWFHLADSSVSVWTKDSPLSYVYTDRGSVTGVPGGANALAGAR